MKKKVVLTHDYQDEAMNALRDDFDLIVVAEGPGKLVQTLRANPDTQALISFLSDNISREVIDAAKNLKIIANYAVGYNNIDIERAREKGIYVTHTPDILTDATADLTMALILAVSRRIIEADAFLRAGKFKGWAAKLLLGKELRGAVLGIIGMGRIGLQTAIRAAGFGMRVMYYDRHRKLNIEKKYGFEYKKFVDLVRCADVVSVHIPYSQDVHHLFNRDVLDLMKPTAIFINAARGPLMDEKYLAEKLERRELFGAGLDVYELEPKVTPKLKKLNNVVLLPHIGSASERARLAMAMITVHCVQKALSGQIPDHLIPEMKHS